MDDLRHKRQLLLTIKKLNDLVTQSKEERSNLSLQITVLTELNTIRLEISQLFGMLTSKLIDDFPLLNQTSRITNDIVALIQQEIERIYEVGIQDAETTLVIDLSKLREAEAILRSFTQIAGTQQKEEQGIGHRLSEKLSKFIVRGTLMDVNVTLDVILSENVVSVNLSAPYEKSGKHLVQMIGNVNKCIIGYQNLTSYLRDVLSLGDEEVEAMWKKFGHELESVFKSDFYTLRKNDLVGESEIASGVQVLTEGLEFPEGSAILQELKNFITNYEVHQILDEKYKRVSQNRDLIMKEMKKIKEAPKHSKEVLYRVLKLITSDLEKLSKNLAKITTDQLKHDLLETILLNYELVHEMFRIYEDEVPPKSVTDYNILIGLISLVQESILKISEDIVATNLPYYREKIADILRLFTIFEASLWSEVRSLPVDSF